MRSLLVWLEKWISISQLVPVLSVFSDHVEVTSLYTTYRSINQPRTFSRYLDQLSFWDTKYRTLHDQKPLRDFTGVASALRSASSVCLSRLQSTASFLVIASDTGVSACAYTVVKSTLQTSLGILQHSDK